MLTNINTSFSLNGTSIIVGLNGSDKTTLLNIITTLTKPDFGNVFINNNALGDPNYKKEIFFIPSDFFLPEYMTGEEYFLFVSSIYNQKFINDKNYFYILSELFDIYSFLRNTIETYSYGMKKKLQICIALTIKTNFLLADELTNGLDFEAKILLEHLIKEQEKTRKIILVSHSMDFISKFSDDIRILEKGKLSIYEGNISLLEKYLISKGDLCGKIKIIEQYNNS